MDTVALMEPAERADIDVSFKLTFTKARERKPGNRSDFEPVNIALVDNKWTSDRAAPASRVKVKLTALDLQWLEALVDAIAIWGKPMKDVAGHPQAIPIDQFKNHLVDRNLMEPKEDGKWSSLARAAWSRHTGHLQAAKLSRRQGDNPYEP